MLGTAKPHAAHNSRAGGLALRASTWGRREELHSRGAVQGVVEVHELLKEHPAGVLGLRLLIGGLRGKAVDGRDGLDQASIEAAHMGPRRGARQKFEGFRRWG